MAPSLLIAAGVGLALVLELMRRRLLREEFSWLWTFVCAALAFLSVWPEGRRFLGRLLGMTTDGSAVAVLALGFLLALALDFSLRISRFATRQKNLAQELALLRQRVDALEGDEPRARP